jgi:hypothetical protein
VGSLGGGFAVRGWGAGQVEAGDLEAVEEETGAFGVDLVAGDAAEDLADGALDGGAVFGEREVEVRLAGAAAGGVFDGEAGGVVVVTKFFVAEAWAAAAVSVGEDMTALERLTVSDIVVSRGGTFWLQSIKNKGPAAGLRRRPMDAKKPGTMPGF